MSSYPFSQRFELLNQQIAASLSKGVPKEVSIEPTKSQEPTMLINGIALHSRYDPQKEAAKELATINAEADCIILAGVGLGYLALAIHRRYPHMGLIIIEPNIDYLALAKAALEQLASSDKIAIFYGASQEIAAALPSHLANWQAKTPTWHDLRARVEQSPLDFEPCRLAFKEYQQRLRVNELAITQYGRLWWANGLKNWPKWQSSRPVSLLFNQFTQHEILVVAAGPSLSYHLDQVVLLQERMVIICVDTAARILLAGGVKPDIIVCIDSQYWNARHLDNIDLSDILIVAEPSLHPMLMRQIPSQQLYVMQPLTPLYQQLMHNFADVGYLRSGGSVTLTAWDLALKLNPRAIWLLGSDFAYPNQATHAKGALFEQWLLASSNRFNPIIQQQTKLKHPQTIWVTGNSGQTVESDARMQLYQRWLEEALRSAPTPCYNLSTLGAAVAKMPYQTLDKALSLSPARAIITNRIQMLKKLAPHRLYNTPLLNAAQLQELCNILIKLKTNHSANALLQEAACQTFAPILPLWLEQLSNHSDAAHKAKLIYHLTHLLSLSRALI